MVRTLSLYETKESTGSVSILDLKNGIFKPSISSKTINDYAFYICRGGWPQVANQDSKTCLSQITDYLEGCLC